MTVILRQSSALLLRAAQLATRGSRSAWQLVSITSSSTESGKSTSLFEVPSTATWSPWSLKHVQFYAKGGKGAKAKGGRHETPPAEPAVDFDLQPFESAMGDALSHLSRELSGLRTGRASPGLVEHVAVAASSHGAHLPVRALGTVVVRGPQLLAVEVYDKQDAEAVAEAIRTSPLKLAARREGAEVLVPVPRLTLDMVERMTRLARKEAEEARARVRGTRHRALEAARAVEGGGADEARRRAEQVQALTDRCIREVDALLKAKEKDLRENH